MWCQTNHTRDYVTVGLEHHGSRAMCMAHVSHGLSCPAQALREAVMLLQARYEVRYGVLRAYWRCFRREPRRAQPRSYAPRIPRLGLSCVRTSRP